MEIFEKNIKIPLERVAVLIGKKGEMKDQLETNTFTKINVDSKEGDVTISGEDGVGIYTAESVIKAIGRGFNPETAMQLLKHDYTFEILTMQEFAKSTESMRRLKGRVIGEGGKSRRVIEDLTETSISVYGKTIGIIGEASNVSVARRAIESLLKGSPHSSVYTWLERQRRKLKQRSLEEKTGF